MGGTEGGTLTEAGHIAAQIIDPHALGAALLLARVFHGALLEEQYVGLHALGIEDAGW
ncbi:hypothetical protein D3C76_1586730 [compost metagenome]